MYDSKDTSEVTTDPIVRHDVFLCHRPSPISSVIHNYVGSGVFNRIPTIPMKNNNRGGFAVDKSEGIPINIS